MDNIVLLAFLTGLVSALSLPIGSALGITTRIHSRIVSAMMAFGAGALLFALSVEIIAHSFEYVGFWPLAIGCVLGGLLYELLNHGLNFTGAFFRKTATLLRQTAKWRKKRVKSVIGRLSRSSIFNRLGPDEIADLVPHLDEIYLNEGETVFREGTRPDALYVIASGRIEITIGKTSVARLRSNDVFVLYQM